MSVSAVGFLWHSVTWFAKTHHSKCKGTVENITTGSCRHIHMKIDCHLEWLQV